MTDKVLQKNIEKLAKQAKKAGHVLGSVSHVSINKALKTMGVLLNDNRKMLTRENLKDLDDAKKKGLTSAMIDRLTLSDKTVNSMINGLKEVASLKSPLGQKYDERLRPNGLKIYKTKVPIGVVGIIYESRPNVTVDAAAICLKSQNAVILRGGSESFYSNKALAVLFAKAMKLAGLPTNAVQLIQTTDRKAVEYLLIQSNTIDLIIPRGGENLIKMVVENSHIPVIKHYKGVCHTYVSSKADIKKAIPIVINAKVQRPGVCNAMETLIIDSGLSSKDKTAIVNALIKENVLLFGDKEIKAINPAKIKLAKKSDWEAEYLDLRLAIKSVSSIEEAIEHINKYGSGHTDVIISKSKTEIKQFSIQVDTSSVIINASSRFADGGEYGMGCEIGISTDKLHARGPMGVDDLTTYKWIVEGSGQIR